MKPTLGFNPRLRIVVKLLPYLCLPYGLPAYSSLIKFEGNNLKAIEVTPEKSSGIDVIYVINGLEGVSISYQSDENVNVKWYSFDKNGGAFSTPINNIIHDHTKTTLFNPIGNSGYIIEDEQKRFYFWLVDYSSFPLKINSIIPSTNQECDATIIDISGNGSPIYYYTINGRRELIPRDIFIEYSTLEWDKENMIYKEIMSTKNIPYISESITINPPVLCPTIFNIHGDRFLTEWGQSISLDSDRYTPNSVNVTTAVYQNKSNVNDATNIIGNDTGLGGSAPADIFFRAYITDAVAHSEWQMASDPDFENIVYRFNEQDLDYTFIDEGTTYVRFVGSNYDGSCQSYGEVYTVSIGASELKIPNAFSPDGDGINDIWKISFKSLIDFDCSIYDRHGHEIYHFNNPTEGWDGCYHGKTVKSGVYFYVITATGADGKKYKRSGDINILKSIKNSNITGGE